MVPSTPSNQSLIFIPFLQPTVPPQFLIILPSPYENPLTHQDPKPEIPYSIPTIPPNRFIHFVQPCPGDLSLLSRSKTALISRNSKLPLRTLIINPPSLYLSNAPTTHPPNLIYPTLLKTTTLLRY